MPKFMHLRCLFFKLFVTTLPSMCVWFHLRIVCPPMIVGSSRSLGGANCWIAVIVIHGFLDQLMEFGSEAMFWIHPTKSPPIAICGSAKGTLSFPNSPLNFVKAMCLSTKITALSLGAEMVSSSLFLRALSLKGVLHHSWCSRFVARVSISPIALNLW